MIIILEESVSLYDSFHYCTERQSHDSYLFCTVHIANVFHDAFSNNIILQASAVICNSVTQREDKMPLM